MADAAPRIVRRGDAELRIFADAASLVRAAADALVAAPPADLVLAGGSTPEALYRELAARQTAAFADTTVWFGDERSVGPDDPASNYRMAARAWLDRGTFAAVHRIEAERSPHDAARLYEEAMRERFGDAVLPELGLVLLGIGDDGHTASLFPDTAALAEDRRWVVANEVPKLATWRITLTLPVLCAAKAVWITAVGSGKASIVGDVLRDAPKGDARPARWPIQRVTPRRGVVWWLDEAAAANVERS